MLFRSTDVYVLFDERKKNFVNSRLPFFIFSQLADGMFYNNIHLKGSVIIIPLKYPAFNSYSSSVFLAFWRAIWLFSVFCEVHGMNG